MPIHTNATIRLADLAELESDGYFHIREDHTFNGCTVLGPALVEIGTLAGRNPVFEVAPEMHGRAEDLLAVVIPDGLPLPVATIIAERLEFNDTVVKHVSPVVGPDDRSRLFEHLTTE